MLAHLGYTHDAVYDGEQALEALKKTSYGLVLMDCQMPRMDGWEATRLARAWQRDNQRAQTPIVILSADISITDDARFVELGLDGFLAKPLRLKVLEDTLKATMGKPANADANLADTGRAPATAAQDARDSR